MPILAIDTSTMVSGAAIATKDRLIAEVTMQLKLPQSQVLLGHIEDVLKIAHMDKKDLDGIAISIGPGSFTGLRIGVATVKGLAFATNKPCIGVSTLEAMAENLCGINGNICCVMDARAGQVYQAFFKREANTLTRLCEDRAIKLDELSKEIGETSQILVGDGANLCYTKLVAICPNLQLAPEHLRYPSAYGVARIALPALNNGKGVCASELDAFYLRPPYIAQTKKIKI